MTIDDKICSNSECEKTFQPKVHNAVYCSDECRRFVTNKRVLDKYHESRSDEKTRKTTKRICSSKGCKTVLSIYNEDEECSACQVNNLKDRLQGWGWDRKRLDEDWSY